MKTAKGTHPNYIHTPGGSPRNNTPVSPQSKFSCGSPLPKFTDTNNSDVNNGQKTDKPSPGGSMGGMIHTPSK
jgi:hypothetical protein